MSYTPEDRQTINRVGNMLEAYAEVGTVASFLICLSTLAELPDEVFASSVNLRIIVHSKLVEYIEHPMLCLHLHTLKPLLAKFLDTMYIHPLFEEDDDDEDILDDIVYWNSAIREHEISLPRTGRYRICYKGKHSEWMEHEKLVITTILPPEIVDEAVTVEYEEDYTYFS